MNDPKIKEAIKNLPPELQEVIMSNELAETLQALAKKYKIHFDKWNILEKDILYTLLSLKKPVELLQTFKHIGIEENESQSLLKDLVDHVFRPMRELLQKTLSQKEDVVQHIDDPRSPAHIKKAYENLDKPFNIGELPEITDPYREKIEF